MANPNLINQNQAAAAGPSKSAVIGVPLIVSLLIIVLSAGVYFAFFFIGGSFQNRAADAQTEVDQARIALGKKQRESAEAQNFIERVNVLEAVAGEHTYWSGVFNDIASKTDKRVQLLSLNASGAEEQVTLEAIAPDYTAVERQLVALNQLDSVQTVSTSDVRYDFDASSGLGTVNFNLIIELVPGSIKEAPSQVELKFDLFDDSQVDEGGSQ